MYIYQNISGTSFRKCAGVCLQDKIHLDDWVYFEYMVTKNMEIVDLKFYTLTFVNLLSYNTNTNNTFYYYNTIGTIIKMQMAWLTGWQVIL